MENLRWILIFAGVAILVLLYFSGRPKSAPTREKRVADQNSSDRGRQQTHYSANDADPLLGDQPVEDQFGTFDEVDPEDFVRPGANSAQDQGQSDYQFEDLETGPGGGLTSLAQKFEAFSERLSPKRRQRVEESEPTEIDEASSAGSAYASKIVTLHVVAPPNSVLPGDQLLDTFERRGYHYGEMNIFHSMHEGATVFSIAKMVEPGFFDINNPESFQTPGVTLILQLPGPVPADVAFEVLVSEAFEIGNELGATVLDERRSTLTKQTVQHMREGIYEYMHREKYFGNVPS
ncbi:MAG: cell division protein ZipA [Gammaproteobacteria bacterium]